MFSKNNKFYQGKMDYYTRKWWFFIAILLLNIIPPITAKNFSFNIGKIVYTILSNALIYDISSVFYIFAKIIPIILILLIIFYNNKIRKIFSIWIGFSYIIFALVQNIAITEEYGIGILTFNLITFILIGLSWFWEAGMGLNIYDIKQNIRKKSNWLFIFLAVFSFWGPTQTQITNFNLVSIFTNSSGMAFCMMTPVFLTILILSYPSVNFAVLRISSFIGLIIAFYNILPVFDALSQRWWHGILHIPLLIISLHAFILSLKKSFINE